MELHPVCGRHGWGRDRVRFRGGKREQAKRSRHSEEKIALQAKHIDQLGSALEAVNRMASMLEKRDGY